MFLRKNYTRSKNNCLFAQKYKYVYLQKNSKLQRKNYGEYFLYVGGDAAGGEC